MYFNNFFRVAIVFFILSDNALAFKFPQFIQTCRDSEGSSQGCAWDKAAFKIQYETTKVVGKVTKSIVEWSNLELDISVKSSRIFAGPNQYPPESYAAYGILAFKSRASNQTYNRHKAICDAYVSSIPHATELSTSISNQMVTVWPIDTDYDSDVINKIERDKVCAMGISKYGLKLSHEAINAAKLAGVQLDNAGPFLLAWSPAKEMGKPDAVVLYLDLSHVITYEQAEPVMQMWTREIEGDYDKCCKDGWDLELIKQTLREFHDFYGTKFKITINSWIHNVK